jgi:hypothetical protein
MESTIPRKTPSTTSGDEHQIGPFRRRTEHRTRYRAFMQLRVASGESRHPHGSAANVNEVQLQAITLEKALILRDVHRGFPFAEGAGRHRDFGRHLRRLCVCRRCNDPQSNQQRNRKVPKPCSHGALPPNSFVWQRPDVNEISRRGQAELDGWCI